MKRLSDEVELLAKRMEIVSARMLEFGTNEVADHSEELLRASKIALGWAKGIRELEGCERPSLTGVPIISGRKEEHE